MESERVLSFFRKLESNYEIESLDEMYFMFLNSNDESLRTPEKIKQGFLDCSDAVWVKQANSGQNDTIKNYLYKLVDYYNKIKQSRNDLDHDFNPLIYIKNTFYNMKNNKDRI